MRPLDAPAEYLGAVMKLCQDRRGIFVSLDYLEEQRARFEDMTLEGTNFEGSDLNETSFRNAILRNVSFRHAEVKKTNFDGATMDKLTYAVLKGSGAKLTNVTVI